MWAVFKIQGFVCKRFLTSSPFPSFTSSIYHPVILCFRTTKKHLLRRLGIDMLQKSSVVKCWSIHLDRYPLATLNQLSMDTWSTTLELTLDQHLMDISVNSWMRVDLLSIDTYELINTQPTIHQLFIEGQPSLNLLSAEYQLRCQSSVNQGVDQCSIEDIDWHLTTDVFSTRYDICKMQVPRNHCL